MDKWLVGWAYYLVEEETEASLFCVGGLGGVHLRAVCSWRVSDIHILGRTKGHVQVVWVIDVLEAFNNEVLDFLMKELLVVQEFLESLFGAIS